jgi:putative ABC transport system permease protein
VTALHLALSGLRARSKVSMAALVAVVVIATIAVTAGLTVADSGERLVDRRADEANVAELVIYAARADAAEVAADPVLTETAGPYLVTHADLVSTGGEAVEVAAFGTGPTVPTVHTPLLRSGRWLEAPEEIVVEVSFADDLGIGVGDTVTLTRSGAVVELEVVGTAIELTDCLYPQCDPGRVMVDPSVIEMLAGDDGPGAVVFARIGDGAVPERVAGELLRSYSGRLGDVNTWLDTRGDLLAVDQIFSGFLSVFGVVVLLATGLVVAGSMTARMVARRREIGLVKAVGASPGQVTSALLLEHLVLGAIGVLIGWVIGSLLSPSLRVGLADTLGTSGVELSATALVVAALFVGGLLVVCTALPAWRAGRLPATEVLRDEQGVSTGPLARAAGHIGGPPEISAGAQDVTARPVRTVLAVAALAVGLAAVIVSVGFASSISDAMDDTARVGDPWDVVVIPIAATPDQVEAAIDGSAATDTWYAQTDRRGTLGDTEFLVRAISGPPGGARFELGAGRMPAATDEAVAGYGLTELLGIDVGDELTFDAGGQPLTVTIVGWYRDTEDTGEILLVPIELLRGVEPDAQPAVWYAVAVPEAGTSVLASDLTNVLGDTARVEAYESDDDELTPFLVAVGLIALLAVVVGVAHLVSTATVSAREQARALGVSRALGRTNGSLRLQAAIGGALIGLLAGLVGIPLGLGALQLLSDAVTSEIGLGPDFTPTPTLGVMAVPTLVLVVLSAVISLTAVQALLRRPTTELIRYE